MKKYIFKPELVQLRDTFINHYIQELGRSKETVKHLRYKINSLYEFMTDHNIVKIEHLKDKDLKAYQKYLYRNRALKLKRIHKYLEDFDKFGRYLYHNNIISRNPFSTIRLITLEQLNSNEIIKYYTFEKIKTKWKTYLKKIGTYPENLITKMRSLEMFIIFLSTLGIKSIYKVETETITHFQKYLTTYEYRPGCMYSNNMQLTHVNNISSLMLYLYGREMIIVNPAQGIQFRNYKKHIHMKYCNKVIGGRQRSLKLHLSLEIEALYDKFTLYHLAKGGSKSTIHNYRAAVARLNEYMDIIGCKDLKSLTRTIIMDYQVWLHNLKTLKNTNYTINTIQNLLIHMRSFLTYLFKNGYLENNISSYVELPQREDGISHSCMTEREVKLLLEQPYIADRIGLRDKAILETFYATGMRSNELINVRINDIDMVKQLCRIDYPKGGKSYQRIVPISTIACQYVQQYMDKVRPLLSQHNDIDHIFISRTGRPMRNNALNYMIQKYLKQAGIRKPISCHSFRVTCATHMLQNKADIRYVQEQLGHRSIRSTQGYTRLVPQDLKRIYMQCHPREKRIEKQVKKVL